MSQLANRAQSQSQPQNDNQRVRTVSSTSHYDTSQTMEMPIPRPTPARDPASSESTLRSRAFAHAATATASSPGTTDPWADIGISQQGRPSVPQSQRSSSESLPSAHSGNGSGRWAEMSYEQINKDDVSSGAEGQVNRPGVQGRRTSSGRWFSWGNGPEQRDKSE